MTVTGCIYHSRLTLSNTNFVGRKAVRLTPPAPRHLCQTFRHVTAPLRCRGRPTVSAAGSAAFELPSQQEVRRKAAARVTTQAVKPAQLPPPPKTTSLWHVLPYLTKLAVSDAQLYWRLGLAFALMIASKAAGEVPILRAA